MHVSMMRRIDFWFGVPLCAFLSLFNWIAKQFRTVSTKSPQRILLIELSEMGSAILAHSALMELRKKYPAAEVYFLIFAKNQESAKLLNVIPPANVLVINDRSFFTFLFSA